MEEKKISKGIICLIVVLILVILGLIGYIVYDKVIDKDDKKVNTETDELNIVTKNDCDETNKENEIDITTNEEVTKLYSYVHPKVQIDTVTFNNDKMLISDMDIDYKFNLAANIYASKASESIVSDSRLTKNSILESDVKEAYETIFGNGTYVHQQAIPFGCTSLQYDENTKSYSNEIGGCGGNSPHSINERIIKAIKYNDTIRIITEIIYTNICKDSINGETCTFKDYDSTIKLSNSYSDIYSVMDENREKLIQYTYTFQLDENGFYRYSGFERTKS